MKRVQQGLPRFVWVFAALLAISGVLIGLGQRESISRPVSDSFAPSGVRALVELLASNGFQVTVVRSNRLPLPSDALLVGFVSSDRAVFFPLHNTQEASEGILEQNADPVTIGLRRVRQAVSEGSRALLFSVPDNFVAASVSARRGDVKVTRTGELQSFQISDGGGALFDSAHGFFRPTRDVGVDLWSRSDGGFVRIRPLGGGLVFYVQDGTWATNRFVDKFDNAAFALSLFADAAGPNRKVVVVDVLAGAAAEPSALEFVGPWAEAMWWQAIVFALVVAWTWGSRFGLPVAWRAREVGTRELLDALAETMQRSRVASFALRAIVEDADHVVRRRAKIPQDAPTAVRNRNLPPSLGQALVEAEAAASEPTDPTTALKLAKRLSAEVVRFTGDVRHARAAKRRRVR